MSGHTKGPWVTTGALVKTGDNNWIACCDVSRVIPDKEMLANARLIAAAPDMLEALEQLQNDVLGSGDGSGFEKARAALAKAEGGAQ